VFARWQPVSRHERRPDVTPYLLLASSYAFAAAVQPGPLQAYLVSQTMINGWRRTVPATLAPIISDIPIVLLVLLVLTHVPPSFTNVIRCAGGIYLLHLAFQALQSYRTYSDLRESPPRLVYQTIWKAVVVNLLNPNPYLGWALIMGPLFLKAWSDSPAYGIGVIILFYGTMILATAGILALFSGARSLGPRIARGLVGVSAAALLVFGLYQLWAGLTALMTGPTHAG
jgi:threonine/homoserine/homoserine lactone efflux protein